MKKLVSNVGHVGAFDSKARLQSGEALWLPAGFSFLRQPIANKDVERLTGLCLDGH